MPITFSNFEFIVFLFAYSFLIQLISKIVDKILKTEPSK